MTCAYEISANKADGNNCMIVETPDPNGPTIESHDLHDRFEKSRAFLKSKLPVVSEPSGGGTLTVTATGGASSIDVGSTALNLNGIALGASAIGTVNSLGVAGANGVLFTNVTGGTLTIGGGTITGNTASAFKVSGGTYTFQYSTTSDGGLSYEVGTLTSISDARACCTELLSANSAILYQTFPTSGETRTAGS